MNYKINTEQKQFLKKLLQEGGKGLVILIAVVMAFKFMDWNSWKLEQAADIAGNIVKEPPAVNLALWDKDKLLFEKSFVHNEKGNYYLSNHFDISGYLKDTGDSCKSHIKITVNNQEVASFLLFRFKRYQVVYTGEHHFVFMTADSGIEDLLRLSETFPAVGHALFKLAVSGASGASGNDEKKETLARYFQGVEAEVNYGNARISIPLSGIFKKGKLYEIDFEYKVSGEAKPVVILASGANRHKCAIKVKENYRKAMLMYSPREDTTGLVLHLLGRHKEKKGRFNGAVSFKDIAVYCYEKEYPWLKEFPILQVSYFDFTDRLKHEFTGMKLFQK